MKKLLLGTTALVGVALMAQPAAAQLEVTVGGSVDFLFGVWDSDDANPTANQLEDFNADDVRTLTDNSTGRDFQLDAEIVVAADGIADNGLQYGVEVQLNANQNDSANVDEAFIYLSGGWGRAEFGDQDSAMDRMQLYAPSVGLSQLDGDWTDFANAGYALPFKVDDTGDDTKVTYFTPRFFGAQFGVTYTPEDSDGDDVVAVTGRNDDDDEDETGDQGSYDNAFEVGVNYVGEFEGVSISASGAYSYAEATETGDENRNAYQLGAQVGFGGFTVGGGWVDNGDSLTLSTDNIDNSAWNLGATYETGPWGFGIQYINVNDVEDDRGRDLWAVGAGTTYEVAPGLAVGADVVYFDDDGQNDTRPGQTGRFENTGWVGVLGLSAAF